MKKSLLASTLIVATALAVPAWADSSSDLGFEYNNTQFYMTSSADSDEDYSLAPYAVSWSSGTFGAHNTLEFILDSGDSAGGFGLTGGDYGVTTIYCDHNGNEDYFTVSGTTTFAYGASVVVDASNFVFAAGEESATIKLIISGTIAFTDDVGNDLSISSGDTTNLEYFVENYITVIGDYTLSGWRYDDYVDSNGNTYSALYATITASTIPEPSMFGILFGLCALGFVTTRRRRRA